jgi:fructan beta-fructosidase
MFTCLLIAFIAAQIQLRPDIVFEDFESANYGRWTATGTAFGKGPAKGTLANQMAVEGFLGKGLVNSFHGGDGSTGTLTSPEFTIERNYISFLIGGGGFEGKTCINLMIDGKPVRTAVGPNVNPGGSERLIKTGWDVKDFVGKQAKIVIVDDAKGGWGHVNVDHIVFTDQKPPATLVKVERTINVDKRRLRLPIKDGGPMRKLRIFEGEKELHAIDVELADGPLDWHAELNVEPWRGKQLRLVVDRMPEDSSALSNVLLTGRWTPTELYREKLRPLIHFSAKRGWLNDPNGLIFHSGKYHLFFQHNPYGWKWGNMHWGHAVSKDLVHWEEVGEALYPDHMGPIFSGSAVIDWLNTSGLGKDGKPPMILAYTAFGPPATQCLAFSNDDGKTFSKYAKNPVIKEITGGNRDPKIIWYEPTKKWVQVLYVERKPKHLIAFFTSPNLIDWTPTSEIEGFFECPDFFELSVEGTKDTKKWVLTAADHRYMIGSFDGKKFTPESPLYPGHRGKGFYAAQTFSDIPEKDGRRIQIGWLQAPSPGMPFNQCMSLPLELSLKHFPGDGVRLAFKPVKEVQSLRSFNVELKDGWAVELLKYEALEVECVLRPQVGSKTTLDVRGLKIVYDEPSQQLLVEGLKVPVAIVDGKVKLTVFADRTAFEIFANDGWIYVPLPFIPDAANRTVKIDGKLESGTVYELKSMWEK